MDELNTYLRIGENIVGQSKVVKSAGLYVDIRSSQKCLNLNRLTFSFPIMNNSTQNSGKSMKQTKLNYVQHGV